ncbi:MAG: DUF177 domain-containing protein [Candidatus Omnitrophica bacterium]|nr:DUF177 domain-containing protein [Candidatus Omnitrophota bacterium]
MKIDVNFIPDEGMVVREGIKSSELELDTEVFRFSGPIRAEAQVSRITNAVTVHLKLEVKAHGICCRCLNDFEADFSKKIDLNYPVEDLSSTIDLNPDIREELILDYPINPLCKADCRGLCAKCGKNLNDAECNCK